MVQPLELFLFKGCDTILCQQSYSLLLKRLPSISQSIIAHTEKRLGSELSKNVEVNVVIGDGRVVRGMNKRFRGVDQATDVLSFPLDGSVLGEVWVCPPVISRNAIDFGQEYEIELVRVLVHGILHLYGFDHRKSFIKDGGENEEIFQIQERIVSEIQMK